MDLHKTGIAGHSEGGMIALDLAARLQEKERPAALVLMATAGRPIDVIVREQLERQLVALKPAQKRAFMAENDRAVKAIRDSGQVPEKLPQALNGLYPSFSGPFWQAQMKLDPTELARRYPGPVLLVQGEADIQISADRDAVALDRALQARSNDDHMLILLPRTSHALKPLQNDKDMGFEGEIDPQLTERIATWLLSKTVRP